MLNIKFCVPCTENGEMCTDNGGMCTGIRNRARRMEKKNSVHRIMVTGEWPCAQRMMVPAPRIVHCAKIQALILGVLEIGPQRDCIKGQGLTV